MISKRKVIIILSATSVALSMIACGGGGGGDNNNDSVSVHEKPSVVEQSRRAVSDLNNGISEGMSDWVRNNSQGDGYDCLSIFDKSCE